MTLSCERIKLYLGAIGNILVSTGWTKKCSMTVKSSVLT